MNENRDEPTAESSRGTFESVPRVYDRWAGVYDWNPVLRLVRSARRRAVASMELSAGDTVVDMGTGTGANLPYLRQAVGPDGTVVGIDVSRGMLAKARDRVARHGWDNVGLLRGDVRNPPIRGPVDGIISSFVIAMFDRPDQLVGAWTEYIDDGSLVTMYAGRSARWYGPAANVLLDGYCHLFEAGWADAFAEDRPRDLLSRRGRRARAALVDRATGVEHDDALFGLVHRDTGYVRK